MRVEQWQSLQELYRRELRERGYESDAAQLAAVAALADLRARLIARRRRELSAAGRLRALFAAPRPAERGVYLHGQVGRGKTWLMDLFYRSLPFPQKRRSHFHHFMQDTHAALAGLAGRESPLEAVAARTAAGIRVLCFDELFVSDIGDAMILGTLFEALIRRGVTLVATSNVPPGELYRDGLQRQRFLPAIDLLQRQCTVLAVDGGLDYRLRSLRRAGTYLLSSAPATPVRLAELFRALARGGEVEENAVDICGRGIPAVAVGRNAVWFTFAAICEGPRAVADYIEIARNWSCVIVSEVPRLGSDENAARRFIALVDELYDRNVYLVISAAAPAPQLYAGTLLATEFRRTASRLAEMQTAEYLARAHRP
ncbi:MAG TPA: cell division protein ZapE [Steroidobacteraceae bacterium]|nr:cell division protein ZapE [Steroidobacteraceae bacterium]